MNELTLGDSLEQLLDHRGKTPGKLGADFTEAGVPVVSAMLVDEGSVNLTEARCVSEETFRKWMPVPTRAGDVLLTSEAPLGRVARITTNGPLVLGQRVFALRGKPGVLDSGFLYYALQTDRVRADLLGRATGTTVVGIRQSALRHVQIPAPNFNEQLAIAEVLGALDDKIAANTRLAETSDELAQAVVASTAGNGHVLLAKIAQITMGSSPPGTALNEDANGIVFYQGVRDFGLRSPRVRVWTTGPVRFGEAGDSLVSVRAPVGQVNIASERTCIGRGLASVRSTDGRPLTLFHLLRSDVGVWAPYEAEGTVFGSINRDQLAGIEVLRVAESDALALETRLAAIEDRLAAALNESLTLAATRDALLPALMSGALRVRDAERAVESMV